MTDLVTTSTSLNDTSSSHYQEAQSTLDGDFEKTARLSNSLIPLENPLFNTAVIGVAGPEQPTKSCSCVIKITACLLDKDVSSFVESSTFQMAHMTTQMYRPFFIGDKQVSAELQLEKVKYIISQTERFYDMVQQHEREYRQQQLSKLDNAKNAGKAREVDQADQADQANVDNEVDKVDETTKQINTVINTYFNYEIKEEVDKAIEKRHQIFKEQTEATLNLENKSKCVNLFKEDCRIPGQNYACISVLNDPFKEVDANDIEREYVVIVWGAFNKSSDADAYQSDTLQHERPKYRHFVVPMHRLLILDHIRGTLADTRSTFKYAVQTEKYQAELKNKSIIEKLKAIPVDKNGKIIKDKTDKTDKTDETVITEHEKLQKKEDTQ
tara:strand:- start:17368 stop:18516 length:1149 start_codon:yes stop_codon:yes gene_type:complete